MATCKECIHTDVCRRPFNTAKTQAEFAQVCHDFKNKAGFIEIDNSEMLCKVDENTTFYDGILHIIFGNQCKTIFLDAEHDTPVTLRDCYKIFSSKYKKDAEMLAPIVIFEDYTHGDIYRYGNHDEYWEKIGETIGFA